jgi:hypothetical protein
MPCPATHQTACTLASDIVVILNLSAAPETRVRDRSERGPIETCPACGGAVRIIACIEGPVVIEKILTHRIEIRSASRVP